MAYIKKITSHQNPTIKDFKALENRKKRKETNLFFAEGLKVLGTAKECEWTPVQYIYEEGEAASGIAYDLVDWALQGEAQVMEVPYDVMGKLSSRDNPQPAIASFTQKWVDKSAIKNGLWVLLEEVRDPGNLGTIIRTVDAVGAQGVILVGNCCDPYAIETVRASMGSIFAVDMIKMDREEALTFVSKEWKGEVVATHLEATDDFRRDYNMDGNYLLMMGSEGPGLTKEMSYLASSKIKIPMRGHADSLNLAVATALVLYEMRK